MNIQILAPKTGVSFNEVARVMQKAFQKLNKNCKVNDITELFIPNLTLNPLGFATWDILILLCTFYKTPADYFRLYSSYIYSKKAWFYGVVEGTPPPEHLPDKTIVDNKIVVPSQFCKEQIESVGYKVKAVIPHAICHEEYMPNEHSTFIAEKLKEQFKGRKILLTIGHLTARKAIPALLQALYILKQKRQDFILVMQTEKRRINQSIENQPPIAQIIEQYNLTHNVYTTEWQFGTLSRSHILGLYQACDYYILPSYSEGFGLTLLEAAAMHKPIITINAPPMNEILGEKECFQVPYSHIEYRRDNPIMIFKYHIWQPAVMAEILDYALSNPQLAQEKGENAYQKSLQYDYINVYKRFLTLN